MLEFLETFTQTENSFQEKHEFVVILTLAWSAVEVIPLIFGDFNARWAIQNGSFAHSAWWWCKNWVHFIEAVWDAWETRKLGALKQHLAGRIFADVIKRDPWHGTKNLILQMVKTRQNDIESGVQLLWYFELNLT